MVPTHCGTEVFFSFSLKCDLFFSFLKGVRRELWGWAIMNISIFPSLSKNKGAVEMFDGFNF